MFSGWEGDQEKMLPGLASSTFACCEHPKTVGGKGWRCQIPVCNSDLHVQCKSLLQEYKIAEPPVSLILTAPSKCPRHCKVWWQSISQKMEWTFSDWQFRYRLITNMHSTRDCDSPRFVAAGISWRGRRWNDLSMTVATQLPLVSLLAQWCPRFCAAATHKLISDLNPFICTIVNYFFCMHNLYFIV